jgi:uncharacterized phage protein (predicted DNA packaging)
MVVSLDEAKLYLRVDGDEEDTLITSFILSAEEICEGVLRFPLTEFETIPDTLKNAVFYTVANLYEKRDEVDLKEVISVISRLLFPYRREGW